MAPGKTKNWLGDKLVSEMRTVTGVIYYEVIGSTSADTPHITLLHNFMSTGRTAWGGILSKLDGYRILLADLPGHGRSLGYPPEYNYNDISDQLADLMWQENFGRGHLAGCSAGGMIAQLLVQKKSVQPASLILVSTTYSTNPAATGSGAQLLAENFSASPKWLDATAQLHDPFQGDGYFYGELLPGFQAIRQQQWIDLPIETLKTFTLPVCIIHGEQDEFFPVDIPERMHQMLPHSELHIIPQQTHALIFRQPWVVGAIMRTFLDSL